MEPTPPIRYSERKSASKSGSPELFKDAEEKRNLEVRNGLLQFDRVDRMIDLAGGILTITPANVAELQGLAIQDIYPCAGTFRTEPIYINNSPHTPPSASDVPKFVEEMCCYANSFTDFREKPLHVSSYLMWRHNWIHPFFGGNGRTSRAVSYLALCIHLGFKIPGTLTIPEQIVGNREPYYAALDAADAAWNNGIVDVSVMESLMERLLETQLRSA